MNKISTSMLAIIGILFLLVSCKKENPIPTLPSTSSNGKSISSFFRSNINSKVQFFTINSGTTQSIIGNKGTEVIFFPNSFVTQSGTMVTGSVQIELIEIYNKKDMILLNKQTMGVSGNILKPLISGGEFNIVAKQNGQVLKLASGKGYSLVAPAPNGINNHMAAFYGNIDENDQLTWTLGDSSFVEFGSNEYHSYFTDVNWINLDYFMDDSEPLTTVNVQLPTGFSPENSQVFISIDGLNSVAGLYNFISGAFTSAPYYKLPIGLNVHFVIVSFENDILKTAVVPSVINDNHLEIVTNLTTISLSDLEVLLGNLP